MIAIQTNEATLGNQHRVPMRNAVPKTGKASSIDQNACPIDKEVVARRAKQKTIRDACSCIKLHSLFDKRSFSRHFQPDSTILLHGDPADAIHFVESGTVRCCTIDADGRYSLSPRKAHL